MNIDFLHNQIIRDTITQRFIESFNENLVPYLISEYGSSLTEVQFYEDHLASGFRIDGEFYYPLTLVCDEDSFTRWIKWPVANYRNYDKFNPYTYKGVELLEFELLDDAPAAVKSVVAGRPIYSNGSAMPVVIASTVGDKTFLAGKYSQGFVDALSTAITSAIELEFGISGLSESGVVLEMRFMPGTFMEHIVENSTYRRVLIKARGCAPRDLWVKWTRLDENGTYTVSDNVDADDILFEIADEVPGKIREKEYRYIATESVEKYQSAMSRKNMTEWREMMRRVIRRGEVEKCEVELDLSAALPVEEPVETAPIIEQPSAEAPVDETDALSALLASLDEEDSEPEITEEDDDLSDLLKTAIGITTATATYVPTEEEDEVEEDIEEAEYEEIDEEVEEEIEDTPVRVVTESNYEDKARLELEKKIRAELEEELRRKHQEAEELRERLEAQLRAEMREKELMAEAARAAIQEQQRLAKEREEAEARAREEEQRLKEEQERALEEARIAKERAQEAARIQAELEEKERARQAAEEAAKAAENEVKYTSKVAKLIFRGSVDPSITKRIHEIILATIKYYHKEDVYIKIKATIPDYNSINLEFVKIPENEIPLLVNIIKVLGRSDLGIIKATLD